MAMETSGKVRDGGLRRGLRCLFALGAAVLAVLLAAWGVAWWQANRDVPRPSLAEHRRSFERGVGWLRAHESAVLADGNAALWWMLQTAAKATNDAYLSELVGKSINFVYQGGRGMSPWRRLIDPGVPITPDTALLDGLVPYQRFFYQAVTCESAKAETGEETARYFTDNTCRPMLSKVFLTDTVCSTHQYMGLVLYQRTRCEGARDVDALQKQLLADVDLQLRLDPIFRDPYIQRVLVLYWFGDPEQVKPAWLRNVLDSQSADGGWHGERHFLGAPVWLQPWVLRPVFRGDFQQWRNPTPPASDFHATAQGILLQALAIQRAGQAGRMAKASGTTP